MSITGLEHYLAIFYFGLLIFGSVLIASMLLVMHFLMPKAVLEKYFKAPYFRDLEIELFTGIPYAPIRTVMFMGVLAFPKWGKKRTMTEAYLLAPRWYRLASSFFCIALILIAASIVIMTIGYTAYYALTGRMKWYE